MSADAPAVGKGLFQSLTNFAATLVAIAHTRLDLLSTDLEEERAHVFSLLTLGLAALFFIGIGVVLTTILLVVAFWDTHRILVLLLLAGFFLAAGLVAGGVAIHKARTKPKLFSASLSELYKDRQQLGSRS
ncbi:phage holin family protein [Sedimenticola hydrogenitrophicus]|uniref:phage holin family protein n=1 Tax=Sedimenticola hydrogenitrophicus TaxID=2967975 RepID=UPI0023B1269A|nr:phage holin family protein [Sedimenticola hydrogenitrophicus]